MPLSITNPNHISQQEIAAIANCNLNNQLLAIKTDAHGGSKITVLPKSDVTFWQMFLRCFSMGTLVNMQVGLAAVTSHLNQYDWAAGANLNVNSEHHQAYLKTCTLANKALYSRQDETLFNNVSTATIPKQVEFVQYQGTTLLNRHNVNRVFKWNPCMQFKHVEVLLKKHFQKATIRIEDANLQRISWNAYV